MKTKAYREIIERNGVHAEIINLCGNYVFDGKSVGTITISKFPIIKITNSEIYSFYIDETIEKSVISEKVVKDLNLSKNYGPPNTLKYTIYIKFSFEESEEEKKLMKESGITVIVSSDIKESYDFVIGKDIIKTWEIKDYK